MLVGLLAGVFIAALAERYTQSQRVGFMPNETSTWAAVLVLILIFRPSGILGERLSKRA